MKITKEIIEKLIIEELEYSLSEEGQGLEAYARHGDREPSLSYQAYQKTLTQRDPLSVKIGRAQVHLQIVRKALKKYPKIVAKLNKAEEWARQARVDYGVKKYFEWLAKQKK